ncbi:MAG: hypothetical protein U1C74_18530 [Phenylobacterium sp.]|nr:hypothetical protein [Phenylobacterium sp.]
MPARVRTFDVEIRRHLEVAALDLLTDAEAEAADEEGYLAGNHYYRDLRGWSWSDVRAMLAYEADLVAQITSAPDSAAAEQTFEDEREIDEDSVEGLRGLDVGVGAAVTALSALGATPTISCNAGAFGAPHAASYPYVGFYLSESSPDVLLELAECADVGLEVRDGLGHLYARTLSDLQRFAELALERFG